MKDYSLEAFRTNYSETRSTEKAYCPFQYTVNVRALVLDCTDSDLTM